MKQKIKLIAIISGLVLVLIFVESLNLYFPFTACTQIAKKNEAKSDSIQGKISISGAFALYPLTVKWAEEFQKLHPGVQIDVSAGGAGKGMTDVLAGMVDLAMFSREVNAIETEKGAWALAVAQDAVFPTMNIANPEYNLIQQKGLTQQQFSEIFIENKLDWNLFLQNNSSILINVYTRSDACGAAATWANYLGKEQENLLGTGVFGDPGMADAVKKDKFGVGYNNLVYLYNIKTKTFNEGICAIPIDINGNRVIDPEENFYNTLDEVMEALKNGKYPSPPARKLYLIANGNPANATIKAFLDFVLKEGQQYVVLSGYVPISESEIQKQLNKLGN